MFKAALLEPSIIVNKPELPNYLGAKGEKADQHQVRGYYCQINYR